MSIHKYQTGFAALLTIVIIGAASLLIAYSAAILGLGELDLGYTSQKGEEAFSITDGCIEEVLRQFRIDSTYNAASLTVSNGSCAITYAGTSPKTVTITACAGAGCTIPGQYNKKIEADVTITSQTSPALNTVSVSNWKEIDT